MNIFDLLNKELSEYTNKIMITRYCDPNYMIEYLENNFVNKEQNIIDCNINAADEYKLYQLREEVEKATNANDSCFKNRETFKNYLKLSEEQKLFYFSFKTFDLMLNRYLGNTKIMDEPFPYNIYRVYYKSTIHPVAKILSNCLIKEFTSKAPDQYYIQKLLMLLQSCTPKIYEYNKKKFNREIIIGKMNVAKEEIEKTLIGNLVKFINKNDNKDKLPKEILKAYIRQEFEKSKSYLKKMDNGDISEKKFKKLVPVHFWLKKRQDLDEKSSLLDYKFEEYWKKYGQLHQNSYIRTIYNKILISIDNQSDD